MFRALLLLPIAYLLGATGIRAQGWIEARPGRHPTNVVRLRSSVRVSVQGRIALVDVEEWFRNDGAGLGEGDYLYPLPGEAVFSGFSLYQGNQELRGETLGAEEARTIYEEIVRRRRDPALIELAGHGLIRARVFPINSGETRRIRLRYTQVMPRAGDALVFRYAVAGPRTGVRHVADPGGAHRRIAPSFAPVDFRLDATNGDAVGDPFSPTHPVTVTREGDTLRVTPSVPLHGAFTLFLPLTRDRVGLTLATHRPDPGEPGYFMLTLSPPQVTATSIPRDLSVVLDVSGSMSGRKIAQARAALHQLLASLGPDDRFRLIAFNNRISVQRPGFAEASGEVLQEAGRWLDDLRAAGGTNIAGALREAFRVPSPRNRLPIILFLTDGLPSVDEQDPDRIAALATRGDGRARVFAFGVGYDVNTLLLDRLTAEGRGTTQYVTPNESVEDAIGLLSTRIRHPVLTDLRLADAPVELTEVYPITLPDLFAGQELLLFGRYRIGERGRRGPVVIRGRRNGRTERLATTGVFPTHDPGNDFIPRLWASRKLGFLSRTLRLEGHSEALDREIRETALRYGLLSEYTSYLVREPAEQSVANVPDRPRLRRGSATVLSADSATGFAESPGPGQDAVGRLAVGAAKRARLQRQMRYASEVEAEAASSRSRPAGGERSVGGRRFTLQDGVWTDAHYVDSLHIVAIRTYGPAWFRLQELAPELAVWLARFERVVLAGSRVAIRIVPDGPDGPGGAELAQLVQDFRGM